MGGRGSGGRRVGAGRKRKAHVLAFAHGSRQRAGVGLPAGTVPTSIEPPPDLIPEERAVWDELAPQALSLRTLASTTRMAFVDLCRARVARDECRTRIAQDGWVIDGAMGEKKHPLEPAFRGWEQRVDAKMAAFGLAPLGKPVVAEAKPEDPFAEFEAPA